MASRHGLDGFRIRYGYQSDGDKLKHTTPFEVANDVEPILYGGIDVPKGMSAEGRAALDRFMGAVHGSRDVSNGIDPVTANINEFLNILGPPPQATSTTEGGQI